MLEAASRRHARTLTFDALRELMTPPDPPKRPIGFVTNEEKKDKDKGKGKS